MNYTDNIHAILQPLIPANASIVLFDFPNHSNVGDSAIWLGEEAYLAEHFKAKIVCVDDCTIAQRTLPALTESTVILIHGGGNFGDLWPRHQNLREKVLKHYPNHRIIQLPQSIHFLDSKNQDRCRQIFNNHSDFHLLVRDRSSLALGQSLHDGATYLCPDMALCLGQLPRTKEAKYPIVGLLRTDKERITTDVAPERADELVIVDWVKEPPSLLKRMTLNLEQLQANYPRWTKGLYHLKNVLYHRLAMQRLQRGCDLLCSGKVVITDRLHGHILCTLMGIPHVVLDNSYRKIGLFREVWDTGQHLCEQASTLDEALDKAHSLLEKTQ